MLKLSDVHILNMIGSAVNLPKKCWNAKQSDVCLPDLDQSSVPQALLIQHHLQVSRRDSFLKVDIADTS